MSDKNYNYKRWYDKKPYADGVLDILKQLSLQSHYDIAREVLKIIETIKINSREMAQSTPVSLGVDRVMGLFSQGYKRRWYDKNLPITRIFKSASCLQDEDFQNIMQGMYCSLSEDNGK